MHLPLFVAVSIVLPPQGGTPSTPSTPAATPSGIELRVGIRTRGATPGAAALEIDRLLAALHDSLKGQHFSDSTVGVALRSITPSATTAEHPVAGFDASLRLTVAPRELPRLPKVLEILAAAGGDEVTGIQFGDGDASVLNATLTDAVHASTASRSAGGKLGAITLFLLAVRREVRP
jgi:uncharacterized protein YggE